MPLTKVEAHNIDNYAVTTEKLSNTAVAAFAQTLTPKISTITETDNTYTALDDTAMNTSGGFIVITGADFQSGASVIIDTSTANSTTFVNTSTLRAELPAKAAGTYNLYVVNPDGGTAIRVNALTYSAFPAFSTGATLSNQASNVAFAVSISATSDSNISYSNTSTLPAGTSLLANGYFFGTVSIGVETTYSFTVKATDVELQDTSRTFSLTVTVIPPSLYIWGVNNVGQLGLNDVNSRSSPTQVGGESTWNRASVNSLSSMATKTDGTLWTWGWNVYGQLGLNDLNNRSSPVQVGSGTTWNLVSVGRECHAATKTDNTLWLWGINTYGQLGQNDRGALNTTTQRSSPTQVAGTTWSQVSAGNDTVLAIKTNGTLWAWGQNGSGQLGLNSTASRSSPTQVGVATNWNRIRVGTSGIIATKTDNTLWVWGSNVSGQLGINDRVSRSSPTQVGATTNWNLVSIFGYTGMATKTDGTLWMWGSGNEGQLGLNLSSSPGNYLYRSSPVQVGSGTTWNLIWSAQDRAIATKTDGTLWAWGSNGGGKLGLNDNIANRSSPVQIGSATTWNLIGSGSGGTNFAIRS